MTKIAYKERIFVRSQKIDSTNPTIPIVSLEFTEGIFLAETTDPNFCLIAFHAHRETHNIRLISWKDVKEGTLRVKESLANVAFEEFQSRYKIAYIPSTLILTRRGDINLLTAEQLAYQLLETLE